MATRKALVKHNRNTNEYEAGFLDLETGEFEVECRVNHELDADEFLTRHNLSVVLITHYG